MQVHEAIRDYFRADPRGIVAVYIFGSRANDKGTPRSDVDIAVLFDRNDPDFIRSGIEEILSQLPRSLRKDVHPLAMNCASEVVLKQVFSKGKCLLVTDSQKLAKFNMIAYARIAGFSYYLGKMQAGLIRKVLEAIP